VFLGIQGQIDEAFRVKMKKTLRSADRPGAGL